MTQKHKCVTVNETSRVSDTLEDIRGNEIFNIFISSCVLTLASLCLPCYMPDTA